MRKSLSLSLGLVFLFGCNQIDPEKEFTTKARAAIQQTNALTAQLKYDDALMVIEPIFEQSSDQAITTPELRREILVCVQNVDNGKKDYDKKIKQGYKIVRASPPQIGKCLVSPEEAEARLKQELEEQKQRERNAEQAVQARREDAFREAKVSLLADQRRREQQQQRIKDTTYTADVLAYNYDLNEVRADAIFKDRILYVVGVVEGVGKDILGSPFITMKGHSFRSVQFMFDKRDEDGLINLSPGQTITIRGTCHGLMMNVLFRDCVITGIGE